MTNGGGRPQVQFSLFALNLVAAGTIATFALKPESQYEHALLLIPIVSFVLFSLWVHHAIVIRLDSQEPLGKWNYMQLIRILTFSIAMLSNFLFLPIGALILHTDTAYLSIRILDIILLVFIGILYLFWIYLQYVRGGFTK